jgi:hypothetical protein
MPAADSRSLLPRPAAVGLLALLTACSTNTTKSTEVSCAGGASPTDWHADADGDGYGDPTSTTLACVVPSGYVEDDEDCDDTDAASYPDAEEVCDGADNDCDGDVDNDWLEEDMDSVTPSSISINGDGYHAFFGTDGYVHLSDAANTYESSTVFMKETVPADNLAIEAEAYFGNTTSGADGIAIAITDGIDYTHVSGSGDAFGLDGLGGYAVVFDTYQNVGDPSGNFVSIVQLGTYPYTVLATDTTIPTLEDNATHYLEVFVTTGGVVEVWIDSTLYLTHTITGYYLTEALIGFGGGTGGVANYQNVDELSIGCP